MVGGQGLEHPSAAVALEEDWRMEGEQGGAVGKKGVKRRAGFGAGKVISGSDEDEVQPGSPGAAGEKKRAGVLG